MKYRNIRISLLCSQSEFSLTITLHKQHSIKYNSQIKNDPNLRCLKFVEKLNNNVQLWEVELLFLVYYVSNYILKYFATSNADDKFQQIISSWRLFMNYSLTQEGQKYDFDRIRPQSTIQSRYLIFQKGKIEITTCNKRTNLQLVAQALDLQRTSVFIFNWVNLNDFRYFLITKNNGGLFLSISTGSSR
ncbi:Hypothetical_protein [Hexamita inflata]|uniref:Hypothetical_protein n=1 Tax=Hexamita inflata TaxID=28002 RepID=A0ABP1L0Y8_9EUKA